MTPVSDTALDSLHAQATEIFAGALEACNIEAAFDRRIRFEGNTLHRLLPDGSGPDTIDLAAYKRVFVVAIGKAAAPMLDVLMERMKRRKGVRGVFCSGSLPKRRNWRFRYFEGGHPLPNAASFEAARATLAMLKKAKKDTLMFFLISGGGSAMFDLPLDSAIGLDDTVAFHQALLASGAPINEINTLRKHFSAVKGGRLAVAAAEATKVSILLPDVPLRTLSALSSGPSSPDHTSVNDVREVLTKYDLLGKLPESVRAFFERADLPESPGNKSRKQGFLPKLPWPGHTAARSFTAAEALSAESEAFRDSVFEVLLSSHDLVESARDNGRHFGERTVAHACTAEFARHRYTPQAARDERVEFGPRQASFTITLRGFGCEFLGKSPRCRQRLLVVSNQIGLQRWAQFGRQRIRRHGVACFYGKVESHVSIPRMTRGQHVIQVIVAKQMQLPANRVVQRMGTCVAPMAIKVMRCARGSRTGQLKQLFARFQCDTGGQDLSFGHRD